MSLYEVLKASKTERFPDYWTLLWGRKMSASMIKTITGVLPLTFTAKGGTAIDWVIEGNDDNGTENVCTAPTAQTKTVGVLSVTTDGQGQYNITISSDTTSNSEVIFDVDEFTIPVSVGQGGNGTFSMFNTPKSSVQLTLYYGTTLIDYWQITSANRTNDSYTGMSGKVCNKIGIKVMSGATAGTATIKPMFTDNGTLPDHYIPYQQGVGERTENKMPVPVNGVYSANRTTVTVTDGVYHIVQTEGSGSSSVYIDIPEFEVPDSGYINYLNSMAFGNAAVVMRYYGESLSGGYALTPINRAVAIGSDYAGKKVNQIQIYTTGNVAMDFTIAPMITDSNTYTAYIPYGYTIPLTISQTGQTDKTVDIYIGDSPLTEGETVSKSSTGVDIELFEGENTVSTTLYNKPDMEIKYK